MPSAAGTMSVPSAVIANPKAVAVKVNGVLRCRLCNYKFPKGDLLEIIIRHYQTEHRVKS